jgi:UDP-N-acetylmuramate--alanine ligase
MLNKYSHIYFLGVGGIGMSALARFFLTTGKTVAGYDRSESSLTEKLAAEGVNIIFDDNPEKLPSGFSYPENTLFIYTPAVKSFNKIFSYAVSRNFKILKRAEVLGHISSKYATIAVAGTHGKTSISCLIAHLLRQSSVGCTAILGGIPKNYETNFLNQKQSAFLVTEADEYDRSFLNLQPAMAVVTSADADHLDVYGNHEQLTKTFGDFIWQVKTNGVILLKQGLNIPAESTAGKRIFTYAYNDLCADIYATAIRFGKDWMKFDLVTPKQIITSLEMTNTGFINIENAVAASFIALCAGISETELRKGLKSFSGVKRRFDKQFSQGGVVFIDDYAHHPAEIEALVKSIHSSYPGKKITGIFQPHLFSRTKDFAEGFAASLDLLDEIILLDIYPAREEPIENVTSDLILQKIKNPNKILIDKSALPEFISRNTFEILLTIGAGDIDRLVEPIRQMLIKKQLQS